MAKIKLEKVGISAGVGVVDEALEWWDEQRLEEKQKTEPEAKIESFRNAHDIGRLVLTGAGLLMTTFDFSPSIGESLYSATIPLLVKSIAKPVRETLVEKKVTSPVRRGRTLVPQSRVPAPGSQQVTRSYQPEFEKAGAF